MPKSRNRTHSATKRSKVMSRLRALPGAAIMAFLGLVGACLAVYIWGDVWCNLAMGHSVESQTSLFFMGAAAWGLSQIGAVAAPGDAYHQQGAALYLMAAVGAVLLGPNWSLWVFPVAIGALVMGGMVLTWRGFYTRPHYLRKA